MILDFLRFFFLGLGEIIPGPLFGVAGTLAGVLFGGWMSRKISRESIAASNKNSIDIMMRQETNRAAADLRSSFCKILTGIKTSKLPLESDIRNFAIASFDAHALEMERFRFYVPECQKEEYGKACEDYQRMVYLRPINHGSSLPVDKFYIEKVEAILRFAKP